MDILVLLCNTGYSYFFEGYSWLFDVTLDIFVPQNSPPLPGYSYSTLAILSTEARQP
jgi:hypothetical protein